MQRKEERDEGREKNENEISGVFLPTFLLYSLREERESAP